MHLLYLLSVWLLPKLFVICLLYRVICRAFDVTTQSSCHVIRYTLTVHSFFSVVYHIFYTQRKAVFVSVCVGVRLCDFCPIPSLRRLNSVDTAWLSVESSEFGGFIIGITTTHQIGTDSLQICHSYLHAFDNFMACFAAGWPGFLGHHLWALLWIQVHRIHINLIYNSPYPKGTSAVLCPLTLTKL